MSLGQWYDFRVKRSKIKVTRSRHKVQKVDRVVGVSYALYEVFENPRWLTAAIWNFDFWP